MECMHNKICRYTDGFQCRDCGTFFSNDSPTYRSGEMLTSIWMVLNNINVKRSRAGMSKDPEVSNMKGEIGIGIKHNNYEDLITRSEVIMAKHNKNSDSAKVELK